MTKTILSLCLAAAAGFTGLIPASASAHEAAAPAAVQTTTLGLPGDTARVNATVIVERRGHRYHRHGRHYNRGRSYHRGRHYNHRHGYRNGRRIYISR